jgi:hypothetical protein
MNSLLGKIHLENKKRRNPNLEEEEEVVAVPQQAVGTNNVMIMCLDLTGENLDPQDDDKKEEERVVVRRSRVIPELPEQDQAMLLQTVEEFGEVIRPHTTSLDRLEKHRGDCKKNAITISEDMLCDCTQKCKDGYECYAGKHVMCKNMLTHDRKCYMCGSRVL